MPAWVSVYCKKRIGEISPDKLLDGIRDNDFWTLAEDYEVDDALVEPALAALRIEAADNGYELSYRVEGERPLVIHIWDEPDRVKEEIEEVLEPFEGESGGVAKRIRGHMPDVQAVIGIEMGFSQLEDMGVVFAYEVARWFGQHRAGLIKDDDDNWSSIRDGAYVHL